jgi:hypothetical protein
MIGCLVLHLDLALAMQKGARSQALRKQNLLHADSSLWLQFLGSRMQAREALLANQTRDILIHAFFI